MTRTLLVLLVVALAAPAVASARPKDIPFIDGPGSARTIQTKLNAEDDFSEIACRYKRPLVVCHGLGRWGKSAAFFHVKITLHKTAPKRGYAMICAVALGICREQAMTYSR